MLFLCLWFKLINKCILLCSILRIPNLFWDNVLIDEKKKFKKLEEICVTLSKE